LATGKEIQGEPCLSMIAARLPGVQIDTFHTDQYALPVLADSSGADSSGSADRWMELTSMSPDDAPEVLLLSCQQYHIEELLGYLDLALPYSNKIGGIVPGSGIYGSGSINSSSDDSGGATTTGQWHNTGVCGIVMTGNVKVDSIVSQVQYGVCCTTHMMCCSAPDNTYDVYVVCLFVYCLLIVCLQRGQHLWAKKCW
jgi:small ligand-binding sensory domain FIST